MTRRKSKSNRGMTNEAAEIFSHPSKMSEVFSETNHKNEGHHDETEADSMLEHYSDQNKD
ncbi:hypothetical protein [Halobacillus sp. A5]|uniref:hypothetical protein n=1 Tax=Halobacillus sp. A5 TaxID=2880263 RepID=UPI0020A6D242|nr:hypothetical protein [Halobacillus sp. A5]MCP3029323.1 hypothetical protein [Halobacillus sp. A5]